MPNEQAILKVSGLLVDGMAVCEALLMGDLVEARFRARLVADHASIHDLPKVEAKALEVVRLLGDANQLPLPDYAEAIVDMSEKLKLVIALPMQ